MIKDIAGMKFGNLMVLSLAGINKHGSSLWLCECDCGFKRVANRMHLMNGATHDCGRSNRCPVVRRRRFMEKVKITTGCWIWTGGIRNDFGYGQFSIGYAKSINAHIASYTIFVGQVPKGVFVLHKCDNPACVNPGHLFLGNQAANMRDKVAKQRQARGTTHGMAKLDEPAVIDIRSRRASGESLASLSAYYGVSKTHIHRIEKRKCWAHIT